MILIRVLKDRIPCSTEQLVQGSIAWQFFTVQRKFSPAQKGTTQSWPLHIVQAVA